MSSVAKHVGGKLDGLQPEAETRITSDENDLNIILNRNRPKHIGAGLSSGVGYIVAGAVGACGIIVLAPTVGAKAGYEHGKHNANNNKNKNVGAAAAAASGGGKGNNDDNNSNNKAAATGAAVVGAVVGTAVGVGSAVSVAAGGILTGVGQILRGAANTVPAVVEPNRGKWWNPNEGKWILTHLGTEAEWIATQPPYDQDILGPNAVPEEVRIMDGTYGGRDRDEYGNHGNNNDNNNGHGGAGVKEMELYDALGVSVNATKEEIQRRYYHIARKFAPTRAGGGGQDANDKFGQIGRAYVILTNDEMRHRYDRYGMAGVYKEPSEQQVIEEPDDDDQGPLVDPMELYSVMYASEAFDDYIGRLAAATNASVGEEVSSKITLVEARILQKRRVTRLALKLAKRLQTWTRAGEAEGESLARLEKELAREDWEAQAANLCSNGENALKMVHLIGQVYSAVACQFLGSFEAGVGMPDAQQWVKRQSLIWNKHAQKASRQVKHFAAGGDSKRQSIEKRAGKAMSQVGTAQEKQDAARQLYREIGPQVCDMLWRQTALDVTNTIHEAAQMVLFDRDLNQDTRKWRGEGLQVLGDVFQAANNRDDDEGGSVLSDSVLRQEEKYREIAFYAVLDTIELQEKAARTASSNAILPPPANNDTDDGDAKKGEQKNSTTSTNSSTGYRHIV